MSEVGNDDPARCVEPTKYSVLQPIFVNPCSYDACVTVLREIGRKAAIKKYGMGDRE